MSSPLSPRAVYGNAVIEALQQRGPRLVRVVCDACGARIVAVVDQVEHGRLFRSEYPVPKSALDEETRKRLTNEGITVAVNQEAMLLDWPDLRMVDRRKPRVVCERHGAFELAVAALLSAADRAVTRGFKTSTVLLGAAQR